AARARDGADLLVGVLEPAQAPVRRRVLRRWLLDAGIGDLTDGHLRSVDALVGRWRGQGGVFLPGGVEAYRSRDKLALNFRQSTTGGG
ncbi:TilS substrate-binding domain-containing protein, partial [Saccharomonospora iraqiensis]|uniref:TilS substrate-binding domain-containing protein n=2 Tax=Saccharomonospora iraqiensis TaxID=52698 RepID=UPI00022E0EED